MVHKIQLKHPMGKKAIRMAPQKYHAIENALLNCLRVNESLTHSEILKAITDDLSENKINFEGSIAWHMEWVKLDLEARKVIVKITDSFPFKYKLS
jgi:hypothetical protein